MITVVTSIRSENRIPYLLRLNKQVLNNGAEHIIVLDGGDFNIDTKSRVIKLPRNIEWVKAMNIGEKFASYRYVAHIDEDAQIEDNTTLRRALEIYKERFPKDKGVLGFWDGRDNSPRWLTTRKYSYENNLGNFMWPEYWHGGDREVYLKSSFQNLYSYDPSLKIVEKKINDASREESLMCIEYDDYIQRVRESRHFPNMFQESYIVPNKRIKELIKNYNND